VQMQPDQFRAWLRGSEADAQELESSLRAGNAETATQALGRITANCKSCHTAYRDVPLSVKTPVGR